MKDNNLEVTVIDSIMGSGKTSYAIQMMDDVANADKKYIFITPFLDEVERIIGDVKSRKFVQPEATKGRKKKDNLKSLIAQGKDIVSTHAMFKKIDEPMMELLKAEGYTLVLDEVMSVLEQEAISASDLKMLLSDGKLSVKDEAGYCKWTDEEYDRDGKFNNIRRLAESNNLMLHNNTALYWTMHVEAFKSFKEVYILTYLFDGQVQKYYYEMFNVGFKYKSVAKVNDNYELTEYVPLHKEDRSHLKELINIHYSDLNNIGDDYHALSATKLKTYAKNKDYAEVTKKIKNNAYNYYYNKLKTPADTVIWTTFQDGQKAVCPRGIVKQFVAVNCRATNKYQDKSVCIYLANIYFNPVMVQLFSSKGVEVNEKLYALSELIQWLWRSRIRNNEPIDIYIPSSKMRGLLEQYLDNKM